MKTHGFTLVEIMVVCIVMGIFFSGAYSLFYGGQKVAGKAAWLQYTVTDLRKAEQIIMKGIQTSSYPSTLSPSALYDAGGSTTVPGPNASIYYVHVVPGLGRTAAKDIIKSNKGLLLVIPHCISEKRDFSGSGNRDGTIYWNVFRMVPSSARPGLGKLIWEERVATFKTSAPPYAVGLKLKYSSAKIRQQQDLLDNVSWVEFQVPTLSHIPSKLTVTIAAEYPRDSKLVRTSSSAGVPNVGITTGP